VAIGKQTAVHYDVTSYTTDRFNVFGGQGTSTCVAGTDGGASGTGLLDPDFKTGYLILGGEWFVARTAKIYTESKIDLASATATGASGDSVFTIGFRYDFLRRTSHQ
jgi:hypothetical protein